LAVSPAGVEEDVIGDSAPCSAVLIEVTVDHPDLAWLNAIFDGAGYGVADGRTLADRDG
jgi:hypothetical protein